ncbi:MAG: hypothetical protein RIB45_15040 [Marivibrio sp.]|uniref:hypothetical protein n=1 Tax=Marivibrio sp. TaxID=2039719 RepID=UPI0032EE6D3F
MDKKRRRRAPENHASSVGVADPFLEAAGVDPKKAVGADFHSALYPGFDNDLSESPTAARGSRAVEAALDDHDPFGDPSFTAPGRGDHVLRVARA